MIKQTLLFFILLFTIWSLVIALWLPEDLDTAQSQDSANVIAGENYLYLPEVKERSIIVGSSMAFWIDVNLLPSEFYNLSGGGMGAADGINLILAKDEKPKKVFIEVNSLTTAPSQTFIKLTENKFSYYLKKFIPAFRITNQPIGVIKGLIMKAMGISANQKKEGGEAQISQERVDVLNQGLQAQQLENFEEVKEKVFALKKHNIEVIFFEMPLHPAYCETKANIELGDLVEKNFPMPDYLLIKQPDCSEYKTNDGVHLVNSSAVKFTQYLWQQYQSSR